MHRIAVIIVTWNASALIDEALHALVAQVLKPDRILIIDNCSADAAQLKARVSLHPDCELILLKENIGFAEANNLAIERCSDVDLIALLNPDAYPEPGWLSSLVAAANSYPDAASFASRLINYTNPDLLDGAGDSLTLAGKPKRRGHGALAMGRYLHEEEVFAPCAAAALYRRKQFVECGGFDKHFFCYVEDIDLSFRLRLNGYRCIYIPNAVVRHVGSASTGYRSDFSVYHGQRNLIFNFVKNMPPVLFWGLVPLHILMNIIYLTVAILIGRGSVVLRAKLDALAALPEIWVARRNIQRHRSASSFRILKVLAKSFI